jgi:hypothetical protein
VEHFVPEHNFADFHIDERLKKILLRKDIQCLLQFRTNQFRTFCVDQILLVLPILVQEKLPPFSFHLFIKFLQNPKENVLIVAPTRELAIQIEQELKNFTAGLKLYSVCCVGGAKYWWTNSRTSIS